MLFNDGTISVSSQKKAAEYGCTLDAVTQLVPFIEQKQKQKESDHSKQKNNKFPVRPFLLVQVDQFGIAHAPFAKGRAFLTEYGFGDCNILIHNEDCTEIIEIKTSNLVPFAPLMEGSLLLKQN